MKKPRLSRQQRREQRQRQDRQGAGLAVPSASLRYAIPPGMTRDQFLEIAAREWAAVTGGDGVILDSGGREVPPGKSS